MAQNVSMIGLYSSELQWVPMLILLLRHPDPAVAELTRQALLYISGTRQSEALAAPIQTSAVDQIQRK